MKEDDITRELWMNMQHAYNEFQKAVSEFVHHGTYPIHSLTRTLDGKINTAIIYLDGGGRIFFRADEWEVALPADGNPVNMDLLIKWEKEEINQEIAYHTKQLDLLLKRKEELSK